VSNRSIELRNEAAFCYVEVKMAGPWTGGYAAHQCALVAAESRAGHYKYPDVERAAHELHEMMEARVKV